MSASTENPFDFTEQLARIRHYQEESDKFAAEQRKLAQEALKLLAEEQKLNRDRWLAPWVLIATLMSSLAGGVIVAVLSHFWR